MSQLAPDSRLPLILSCSAVGAVAVAATWSLLFGSAGLSPDLHPDGVGLVVAAVAAAVIVLGVGIIAGTIPGRVRFDVPITVATLLGLYAILAHASDAWSLSPQLSHREAVLAATYALAIVAGRLAGGGVPTRNRTRLAAMAIGLPATVTCAAALLERGLGEDRIALTPRLGQPFGLPNGLALLAIATLLSGLALACSRQPARTVLAGVVIALGSLTLALTASRAGVALGFLAVVAFAVTDRRPGQRLAGPLAALPGFALGVWASTWPAFTATPPRAPSAGAELIAVVAGAAAVATLLLLGLQRALDHAGRKTDRIAAGVVTVAAAAAGIYALAALLTNTSAGTIEEQAGADRLLSGTLNQRGEWWRTAWDGFLLEPARGFGAGAFRVVDALSHNDGRAEVVSPHNTVLQALLGLGVVGGLLILAAGVTLAVGLARVIWAGNPAANVAALSCGAVLAQGLVDVSWDIAPVAAIALLSAGLALRPARGQRNPRWTGVIPIGLAMATLLVALPSWRALRALDTPPDATPAETRAAAEAAVRADSTLVTAWIAIANSAALEGDRSGAETALAVAIENEPASYAAWQTLGERRLNSWNDIPGAIEALQRAYLFSGGKAGPKSALEAALARRAGTAP